MNIRATWMSPGRDWYDTHFSVIVFQLQPTKEASILRSLSFLFATCVAVCCSMLQCVAVCRVLK